VNVPTFLREELARRSPSPERQKIILALLLQPPAALLGRRGHKWQPSPLTNGSPAGGQAAAVRDARED
jgi:hypothetical protein